MPAAARQPAARRAQPRSLPPAGSTRASTNAAAMPGSGPRSALPIVRSVPCPRCCSMPPAVGDRPLRCRASMPVARRGTTGCATRPTRPLSRRSSPSCASRQDPHGLRMRGLIVVLWRAGLRIQEALALAEADLDPRRGAVLVRRGKGGRRREVGMDDWAWEQLQPWLSVRVELHLPAGHRQRRDSRHRPRPPPANGVGQQHAAALTTASGRRPHR